MKRNLLILIPVVIIFFLSAGLSAQESTQQELPDETSIIIDDTQTEAEEAAPGGAVVTAWDIIRMILILIGVLIVIYLIFYFMRKAGGPRFQDNELITMHASLGLGGNKSVHLIEAGREFFLVGAGDDSVNLISKIDDKESVDDLRFKISTSEESGGPTRNFADIFSRMFKRGQTDVNLQKSMMKNKDFMKEQRERLKKM